MRLFRPIRNPAQITERDLIDMPAIRSLRRLQRGYLRIALFAVTPAILGIWFHYVSWFGGIAGILAALWLRDTFLRSRTDDVAWKDHLATIESGNLGVYHRLVRVGILADDSQELAGDGMPLEEGYLRLASLSTPGGPVFYDGRRFIAAARLPDRIVRRLRTLA